MTVICNITTVPHQVFSFPSLPTSASLLLLPHSPTIFFFLNSQSRFIFSFKLCKLRGIKTKKEIEAQFDMNSFSFRQFHNVLHELFQLLLLHCNPNLSSVQDSLPPTTLKRIVFYFFYVLFKFYFNLLFCIVLDFVVVVLLLLCLFQFFFLVPSYPLSNYRLCSSSFLSLLIRNPRFSLLSPPLTLHFCAFFCEWIHTHALYISLSRPRYYTSLCSVFTRMHTYAFYVNERARVCIIHVSLFGHTLLTRYFILK